MWHARLLLLPVLAALMPSEARPADLVACIVAPIPNNPSYHGMATTVTRLKCEFTREDFYPTLGELYKLGWRLIEVVGGELALSPNNQVASPLYFLEREGDPAGANDHGASRATPDDEMSSRP